MTNHPIADGTAVEPPLRDLHASCPSAGHAPGMGLGGMGLDGLGLGLGVGGFGLGGMGLGGMGECGMMLGLPFSNTTVHRDEVSRLSSSAHLPPHGLRSGYGL